VVWMELTRYSQMQVWHMAQSGQTG
jgi:hypothetical protein